MHVIVSLSSIFFKYYFVSISFCLQVITPFLKSLYIKVPLFTILEALAGFGFESVPNGLTWNFCIVITYLCEPSDMIKPMEGNDSCDRPYENLCMWFMLAHPIYIFILFEKGPSYCLNSHFYRFIYSKLAHYNKKVYLQHESLYFDRFCSLIVHYPISFILLKWLVSKKVVAFFLINRA